MRTLAVALVMAVVLAGCGGGGDPPASSKKTATKTTSIKEPKAKGTAVPEALTSFRCGPDKKGRWNASGYLTNSGKAKVTYQVTVYVGEAAGDVEDARTAQVASVAPGGSVKFSIRKVPAPKAGGPCHVQVLAGG